MQKVEGQAVLRMARNQAKVATQVSVRNSRENLALLEVLLEH